MQLFDQIRKENTIKYGTRVSSYIPIIINQYSDRTHFIYEIIQNAEDAGASYINFRLYKDRLEIFHNGRPFNEKDIVGVCGIADGTKNDGTRIGHFGIGFKAVYGYTCAPKIYSGEYSFEIEDYLSPYEIEPRHDLNVDETCMVLPFDKDSVSKELAFREIREALIRKITAESILMLEAISDIKIEIADYAEVISINKEKGLIGSSKNVYELSLLTQYTNQVTNAVKEHEDMYLFFTDGGKEAAALVFRVKDKKLQEVRNSKIYAFFPMAKEAHQNFYIHAPFDTTPARDNFKEGEDFGRHNIQLVNNICRLISFAFIWLRDNGYLSLDSLNKVYPIYEYEETDLLYAIYRNSVDIIKNGEPLLPTNKENVYKSVHEICVPENMGIVNVFDDADLQKLLSNRKIFWLSKEISTSAYTEFKHFLDRNFEFKTYEWRHLVLRMDAEFLKSKSVAWMERLMGNIESFCINRGDQQSHYMDVSRVPFVRLSNGEHICAYIEGKLQVYLNNPTICKLKILEECRRNETIKSFYERALRIPNYDLEREALDKILPKYSTRKVAFKTGNPIRENIEDLKVIKDAIQMNPLVLDQVADKYIVTDGKEWYRPSELYIRSMDARTGYDLVRGIINIKFLANSYFDDTLMTIRLDEEFFKKLGCSLGIRAIAASRQEYLSALGKYCGAQMKLDINAKIMSKDYISKKLDWAFSFEGFPEVFKDMSPEKSLRIARFLNGNALKFDIRGEAVGADDQNFSGRNVDSAVIYTMLGLQLSHEKWVYIKGNPEAQAPADVDRDDLIEGYEPAKRLFAKLPFREAKNAVYEYLETLYKNKADLDLVRNLMSDPEMFLEIAKAKAKSDAKKGANDEKKKSLKERLENCDREQREPKRTDDSGPEYSPISEKALAKREQKLEDELTASLENHVLVTRGAHFTRKECSEGEKLFLREQYDGYCQMCGKKIRKWDGDSYFEAINIFKPSTLFDNLASSFGLGWNSLCLCPNCAAEYNYCSKKVSEIYTQVMSTDIEPGLEDPIEIVVEIPRGEKRIIKYSARHFLALKKAFEIFAGEQG